jgi:hypothetical protein
MKEKKTPLSIYLGAAIEFIPEDELVALLAQFGYTQAPTVPVIAKAMIECGEDFIIPFAQLAKDHCPKVPKPRKVTGIDVKPVDPMDKLGDLSKNTPTTTNTSNWGASAFGWFGAVTDVLLNGVGKATDLISVLKGDNRKAYEYMTEAQRAAAERERTTRTAIWGCVGLVVAVIFFFIMYKMFQRH